MAGATSTAYELLLQKQCPSWLYAVTMGATTVWERWDSLLPDGAINPGQMTSFNHYAFGAVADWAHRVVAGLAPAAPGYKEILFQPRPRNGITYASARHESPYGTVAISWHLSEGRIFVDVTVPTGSTAVLDLEGGTRVPLGPGSQSFAFDFTAPH
jgi:alpha-L-rhamnosidase